MPKVFHEAAGLWLQGGVTIWQRYRLTQGCSVRRVKSAAIGDRMLKDVFAPECAVTLIESELQILMMYISLQAFCLHKHENMKKNMVSHSPQG